MSDNSFEIQVINDSVGQALGQLLAQAHNLRPALLDFAEWAKAETDQRFADQADWHGQPWAPNAELTLANYLRNHGGSKNFKKDGKLSAAGTRPPNASCRWTVRYAGLHSATTPPATACASALG
jgi:hypothetical protein